MKRGSVINQTSFVLGMAQGFSFWLFLAWVGLGYSLRAEEPAEKSATLKLLTYNVLADDVAVWKRIPELFKLFKESDADIITLQEVAPWFLKLLKNEEWLKKYHLTPEELSLTFHGEYLILSKQPIQSFVYMQLPGKQKRGVWVAKTKWNGRTLAVGTAHLESFLEDGPTRAKQLDAIFPLFNDTEDAIFMGDFNFGDKEEPDTAHLDKKFYDVWQAVKPNDPGFTWNIEVSDMAKNGSFPQETSRRIDRILVRSERWKPESIAIIGDQPVEKDKKDVFPSDHFGLTAVLKFTEKP